MKRWVVCVATAVVLLWGLLIPLAIAADPCLAMCVMFVCEGSCGASSGTTRASTAGTRLDPAAIMVVAAPDHAVALPLTVPKPPPKSSLLSA
jgi:hypothetical protein